MSNIKAELIDYMGNDLTVVNAARVSFDKHLDADTYEYIEQPHEVPGFHINVLQEGDQKLVNYLATHGHWTPFSHPQITLRFTVPIFVARQEFKHIVGFTRNEVSRRYVDDEPEFYTPDYWRKRPVDGAKQGSLDVAIDQNNLYKTQYKSFTDLAKELYEDMIEDGIAPEQARMILPQSMMTSYYVTGSLAAFARMFKQRTDPHAQKEIQELAKQVDEIIRPLFPVTWGALTK